MSKMRLKWLWAIVALEVLAVSGLLIWGLVVREPAKAPTNQDTSEQLPGETTYKTPKLELIKVVEGLEKPVAIVATADPADKRLFVVEQAGTVRTITADGKLSPEAFLDIRTKVQDGGEMGLLGLAFHPKFKDNNFFYVNYVDNSRNTIVARYTASPETGLADKNSEKILLKIRQPFVNHNGGQLAFGPDGFLYIGMGDGGSAGDPGDRAQDKNDLLGKMLRINVDSGNLYSVPAGNPYANGGGEPEIWALGLRNPWRFSFDRQTGDLFVADVGQGDYEEVNLQLSTSKGGENYGWRCYEGGQSFNTDDCLNPEVYTKPILQYDHGDGRCSVTGGYVYRGSLYPALAGSYFYGDYCNGQLFYAQSTDTAWQSTLGIDTKLKISTFGESSAGELYVADYESGTIYQITDIAN